MGCRGQLEKYCSRVEDAVSRLPEQFDHIERAIHMVSDCFQEAGKILLIGNGGSAADAQHLAAELVGRFMAERKALPAIALTTDTSILTAVANDYSFDRVFARQIEALGRAGDVLIAISTSGNSRNIIEGVLAAKNVGLKVIGMTGSAGGRLAEVADLCISAPTDETSHIQELHIMIGHMICAQVEELSQ
ncbi:D-sedoheptulose 7-phosphate isomerase [Pseudokordiimonas caeni]|uniref:D-sedoheptulose 7-phosphate isomerase n=1 Tax=Pseudokordiimonas caeni TaxID=2997908 RepID=UPI002810DC56|nr:D-sedoheptulose 7-phosphate isomerase [Pseudokordiimonas caeni]